MPIVKYEIQVKTNDATAPGIENTGTDAAVFIELRGAEEQTFKVQLTKEIWTGRLMSDGTFSNKPIWNNAFERGSQDRFAIEHSDIGEIGQIVVSTNDAGDQPGWLFDFVYVNNHGTPHHVSYFDNDGVWLGVSGGRTDITLDRRPL